MNSTDYLQFSDLKIFKNLCQSLPTYINKSINVLTIKDGLLYAWDFANSCVLTLNVKAARSRIGDIVSHQSLLPAVPVLFNPEFLLVNETSTLLVVAGGSGVLVMELPPRYPPYGAFEHNKELVYCKSHCLDERLFLCSDIVQVRQVRFHPGSSAGSHIVILTSDNFLRLYNIENSTATSLMAIATGRQPMGRFPGTKTSYLQALGDVAVDFDFGHPQAKLEDEEILSRANLDWPAYILRGNGAVYSVNVPLENRKKPKYTGPLPCNIPENESETCSIVSLGGTPEVFCIANSNGTIYHCVLLKISEQDLENLKNQHNRTPPSHELMCFESIELELGLSTCDENNDYTCPIFLYKDLSKIGRYFAVHSAGVHSVAIANLEELRKFSEAPDGEDCCFEDLFAEESKAEYLVCTKTAVSDKNNPVVGFALYYEPTSLVAVLGDGKLVTLALLTAEILPDLEHLTLNDSLAKNDSTSVKTMSKEPFDLFIQKLLKRSATQPILKLPSTGEKTPKETLELIQRASQVFKDQIENHTRSREELEKRTRALQIMKEFQFQEIQKMTAEKQEIQQKAEELAEKYEDIKDKQDVLMKRCEKLLILVTQKQSEPSDAEEKFFNEMKEYSEKVDTYKKSIEKVKLKMMYQQVHISKWKEQEQKKVSCINERHSETIKTHLQDMGSKIAEMVKQIKEYKERLNLK